MKTKGFAAGVNRDDLFKGADELGIDLDEHIANVLQAMSSVADVLGLTGIQETATLG
jgi:predicted hydrolase (HD superfamily)